MNTPKANHLWYCITSFGALVQLMTCVNSHAATFTVTTTADAGPGSLRQAIIDANATPGADVIEFSIPGTGPHTITPGSQLPTITDPAVLDGYTQPGSSENTLAQGNNAALMIELDGSSAADYAATGLDITAGASTVRGLVINRFAGYGLRIRGAVANVIAGNFIGTDVTGTTARGNGLSLGGAGIFLGDWGPDMPGEHVIGGLTPADRNLISGNSIGIVIAGSDDNQILGNFIGVDASGSAAIPNIGIGGIGIWGGTGNRIGAAGAGNLISGNIKSGAAGPWDGGFGIATWASDTLVIEGNRIGTDVTGTSPLGNQIGISISGKSATIGGTASDAGNLVSGNQFQGMALGATCVVQGNRVGTDATGTTALANEYGIVVYAPDCLIGGTDLSARNLISGNSEYGLQIHGSRTIVEGNFIGTDATGSAALPNMEGIILHASENAVGGTANGARNLISGNSRSGVDIRSSNNKVEGNLIGTDVSGTLALPSAWAVWVADASDSNLIGGALPGSRNIIVGSSVGVLLSGPGVTKTRVIGNLIGTDATGTMPLGNAVHGVQVENGSSDNVIGAPGAGEGNTIAHNSSFGVFVSAPNADADPVSTGNSIRGNSIFDNDALGIKLGVGSVLPNDLGDADSGPNHLQNYPILTSANSVAGGTSVSGTLNSTPSMTFILDFYANQAAHATGYGEGETYLGAATVTTDAGGNVSFTVTLPTVVPVGRILTATATDPTGNTSEFSGQSPPVTTECPVFGFTGFLPPIGGADATGGSFANPVRTFKNGSTIPVKFTASCNGTPVLTGIHRLQAVKYSDATTAAAPIDATPQDAATTGNQFRLTDTQWHFNLDTRGAGMSPGIWQLVATLSDGSQHHVWIALK